MPYEPTDVDKLATYLLDQIHAFIRLGDYEEFATGEALASLEIVKMELFAGALKDKGFHRWPEGIDQVAAAKLRQEDIEIAEGDVIELDDDDEEDDDE